MRPADPSVEGILGTIGMTPVIRLNRIVPSGCADIYVKLEYLNPTGSYKDRMALSMIEEAEQRGDLKPGMTVVEYTGGSTGSSLAFVCAVKGYRFRVVSSDAFATEKLRTMQLFGAELHIVPSEGGNVTPDLTPRMIEKAKELASEEGAYFTNQLYNQDVLAGYRNIGRELVRQFDRRIDLFCGSVGTAGMLMGVAGELKEISQETRIIALEPASSSVISGNEPGSHRVEGIGIGFRPPLFRDDLVDGVLGVDEEEGRAAARRLAMEEGVFAGTSTGLNVAGALRLAKEVGPGGTVVTVAVDTGLKYLAGDLFGTKGDGPPVQH